MSAQIQQKFSYITTPNRISARRLVSDTDTNIGKGKVHPCTGHTAHSGSRGIALLFHDHGTERGWDVSVTPRPLFTPRKDPVPIVQEAGWALGPLWTGAENLAPTRIRFPDRPARTQSLYRLSYLAHILISGKSKYTSYFLWGRTLAEIFPFAFLSMGWTHVHFFT